MGGVGMAVEFSLLGGVEARVDGRPVELGHARQRWVLGALLVDANRVVPVAQLLHRVWGDRSPQRAPGTLYSYLSRLRQALACAQEEVRITRQSGGYVVEVDASAVDLHRFRRLVEQARTTDDGERAAALFEQALGLWQGEALHTPDTPYFNALRETLCQEKFAAELDLSDTGLRLGRHTTLLAELSARAETHPLDERLANQLMLALYRSGRPTDALHHYHQMRVRLSEELGTDPGVVLQRLHQQILTADAALAVSAGTGSAPGPAATAVPRQLPSSPPVFTGRSQELEQLTDALDAQRSGRSVAVVISAIGGIGGVGKSWLALRWAHENVARFPDGQLYVNLRGFDPSSEPLPTSVALRGFLDALGVDPDAVPMDPQAQSGLYRSLLADKRMVVVLDDARDADQVRPLLPGSPSCTVLITSRDRLTSLVTTHGAEPLTLDVFHADEARELFDRRLGTHRIAAEPDAVSALLEHCAGLPLALGVVAARAATHPGFPLAVLADELREATSRLDVLDVGDVTVNLRAVFSTSHRALTPRAQRLFALLGLVAGPDISLAAVASLAGLTPARARVPLGELEAAHLIQQLRPGRYRMHDLIRLFAAELGDREEDAAAALTRLIDFYLHTAFAANELLDGPHSPFQPELLPPAPGCSPLRPADTADALEWFDAERPCLLAAQGLALAQGQYAQVWRLAWTLVSYHVGGHHLQDYFTVWRTALTAAERHGDSPAPRALAHWRLGHARTQKGEHTEALDHLNLALSLSEQTDDIAGQAHVYRTLGWAWEQCGDDERALHHAIQALRLYQTLDNPVWQANQLNAVGWMHAQLGRYPEALSHCEQALALFRKDGRPGDEASTLDSLGYIAHHTGRYTDALDHYQQAMNLVRGLGNAHDEADTLANLGETYHAMGRSAEARDAWREALSLYEDQRRTAAAQRLKERMELAPEV
ncbi:AfsR/SARP family transcriptional regulator [Streptomyces sp. AK02-01A]|uniref:AfsR/SARP family transcriptional regulator n=1 Tax=Streptomyces sp. AK02-01A TaxID=3028648 RepID=UPI0029B2E5F1|nr:BTAD domain-containing putative transcriptional regulator [Streptomyces sp. AK02-01A]MDX3853495.1 BTAD domain-containing putative transcriptional regulator [Streptomyces sp. AK02-01A]